jgi:hypothetical protein
MEWLVCVFVVGDMVERSAPFGSLLIISTIGMHARVFLEKHFPGLSYLQSEYF